MSRVTGQLVTQESHPCGRLVPEFDYDCAEKVLVFYVPSSSRDGRVYGVEIDSLSLECRCRCEDWTARVDARKNRLDFSTYLELVARSKGVHYLPTITRRRNGLCKHVWKAITWMKRHGLWDAVLTKEKELQKRAEGLEVKKKR